MITVCCGGFAFSAFVAGWCQLPQLPPNYTQLPTRTNDQLPSVRDGVAGPCDVQGAIFFVGLVKDGYTFGAAALPGAPLGAASLRRCFISCNIVLV